MVVYTKQESPFYFHTGCGYTLSRAYKQSLNLWLRRWDKGMTMVSASSSRAELSYLSGQTHLFLLWCMLLRFFRSAGILWATSFALPSTWEAGLRPLKNNSERENENLKTDWDRPQEHVTWEKEVFCLLWYHKWLFPKLILTTEIFLFFFSMEIKNEFIFSV